jgi:hypothetical protein
MNKPSTLQAPVKQCTVYSNSSEYTASSEKEGSSRHSSKVRANDTFDTARTVFSASTENTQAPHQVSPRDVDMEVEVEEEINFSLDSPMLTDEESVHSKIVSEYGRQVIDNFKKKEVVMTGELLNHEIKGTHRKQMIVWMEEVLRIFKCPLETFFMSVHVMDRYMEFTKESLKLSELHEIGIVSMFLASKYQEIEPLTLDLMISKVAHGKITEKTIRTRELKILNVLKFKLSTPNVLDFLESFLEYFSPRLEAEDKLHVKEMAVLVAKNGIADRKSAFTTLPSELALCSLIIAIKGYSKQVRKNILTSDFSLAIKSELKSDEAVVLQIGKRLKKLSTEKVF